MRTVRIKESVLAEILREAKKSYPLEICGYLIGKGMRITGVVWPRQVREKDICYPLHGEIDRISKKHRIVGTVHTHTEIDKCVPSDSDLCDDSDESCMAVVSVYEENHSLRARIMFFEPLRELQIRSF